MFCQWYSFVGFDRRSFTLETTRNKLYIKNYYSLSSTLWIINYNIVIKHVDCGRIKHIKTSLQIAVRE